MASMKELCGGQCGHELDQKRSVTVSWIQVVKLGFATHERKKERKTLYCICWVGTLHKFRYGGAFVLPIETNVYPKRHIYTSKADHYISKIDLHMEVREALLTGGSRTHIVCSKTPTEQLWISKLPPSRFQMWYLRFLVQMYLKSRNLA